MIFVIRPEPGLQSTLQAARNLSLPAVGMPLFQVIPLAWEAPEDAEFDGLLAGSGNAFRHGGKALESLTDLPVHAVGEATAEAAREAGFTVARTGEGGLQALLDKDKAPRRYLRLAGAERVDVEPGQDSEIVVRTVYEVRALPIGGSAQVGLSSPGALVLLHSAAAARHFAAECDRLGLARSAIALAALGPRIAAAAGHGWREVRAAEKPADCALLALARDMCH
ncbi:uroporphyrinogen-III synthase [Aurantiacibacter spongiae]|uniref:Uroporphyrinogen-III synthase n=1 Tax=Aurantiacibacter spongiae TaxID=2488860 RepID=A0A3N5DBZ4_9SPHN|nr:uroporphyrinogen-III synthase [Aurantiacibacter spongiae]RPF72298.1 uroporphyrinogen-III synthase [Aurantiacibacter spongiae]